MVSENVKKWQHYLLVMFNENGLIKYIPDFLHLLNICTRNCETGQPIKIQKHGYDYPLEHSRRCVHEQSFDYVR